MSSGSARFFALLVPEVLFNNGVDSLDKASFVLGTFLNVVENDVCFSFASSVIFLNVSNVSEAFVFVTRNREIVAWYGMTEIFRDKQNEV